MHVQKRAMETPPHAPLPILKPSLLKVEFRRFYRGIVLLISKHFMPVVFGNLGIGCTYSCKINFYPDLPYTCFFDKNHLCRWDYLNSSVNRPHFLSELQEPKFHMTNCSRLASKRMGINCSHVSLKLNDPLSES